MTDFHSKVLIVDDEPIAREALEGVLFLEDYQLIFAQNGSEACRAAVEHMPDLILLDVMMPQMDGYEVCRRLRENPVTKDIPILLITALDDRSSRLRGIEAGADDFISKPFDRVELRARVRTITRLNRFRAIMLERSRFQWVVEQSNDGYLVVDSNDRVAFANSAACTFLNLPAGGKTPGKLSEWAQRQFACEPQESWEKWPRLDNTSSPLFLIRSGTQSAQSVWLQLDILRLPSADEDSLLLKISDVSDRLAQQQEIWTFQSMLTHKLLTPFSQISMSAELIARQAQRYSDPEMKDLAESVLSGTRRVSQEVKDMLGYLSAPSLAQTGKTFDLACFADLFRSVCRDISVPRFEIDGDQFQAGSLIRLGERAMDIILHELVENSKKFHPLLTPTIHATLRREAANNYLLTLRDDGVFLTPDQLKQAWTPYYQAEKSFTGEIAGMGLGLSTVATLLWEVGGKYRMYNREDRPGVIVELSLPSL